MVVAKKPRILIIGAGMAGLTAAHTLHTTTSTFDIRVVEASDHVGGRIRTASFSGVRVETGATWIHGIGGSPIYSIAHQMGAFDSPATPWERMDGFPSDPVTVVEGGFLVDPNLDSSICSLFRTLMDFASTADAASAAKSVGALLQEGLHDHRKSTERNSNVIPPPGWNVEEVEDAVFAMHVNMERTYTSADDLNELDLAAESEYCSFPNEEITIAKGYSQVIEHLASALPPGMVQMGKKVDKIEWCPNADRNDDCSVQVHFTDGSAMLADHVIVTVSLGVLKAGKCLFSPPLPEFKRDAIGRLGFGLVNKLFMEHEALHGNGPLFLQMAFDQDTSRQAADIPRWIRRTTSICPVYGGSNVLLSWFVGKEAAKLEKLNDDEIIKGVNSTLENFSPPEISNGGRYGKIRRVMRSGWGSDPLFLGSYSYVAVGSSGEDLDLMAEPLPRGDNKSLQILFAGEATHRTHYSTTHGAYFSGIREANRLLQHYKHR